jgi:type I restriction enzyme, R subunit
MPDKEATARIKINKLEGTGWRLFPDGTAPANICLEPSVRIKTTDLDARKQLREDGQRLQRLAR